MATLQDIADQAGVSLNTASRILAGQIKGMRRDAVARAALVHRIAQEMNYRPNSFAKAIRSGRFGGIALLLSTQRSRSYLPSRLLEGIEKALVGRDLHLTLTSLPDEVLTRGETVPKILRQAMADGLLINYTHHIPGQMIDLIDRNGIPCVWLNTSCAEDGVRPDDENAAYLATCALLERGHRRICFAHAGQEDTLEAAHYSIGARLKGYSRAVTEAGFPVMMWWAKYQTQATVRAAGMRRWLGAADRPTAIVAYAPMTAMGVLTAAYQLGLRVPEDLSVVTFSDAPSTDLGIQISTMLLPELEMGRCAVEMLEKKIDAPTGHLPSEVLPFSFEQGQTMARVPS